MGSIYTITNNLNGKIYIGLTTNSLSQRFAQHKYEASRGLDRQLYRAMRKYDNENFSIEEIDTDDYLENLKLKEIY